VDRHAPGVRGAGGGCDRLHDAGLVVRVHDRDEHGVGPDRGFDGTRVDHAVRVDGNARHAPAARLERTARLFDGRMLDRRRDQMPSAIGQRLRHARDRGIVRFRAAARENDLIGLGPYGGGDLGARGFDHLSRGHAVGVRR
jgi:hypothetical protein